MMDISLAPNGGFRLRTGERTFIDVPADAKGITAIYNILYARERSADTRIGTEAKPTQWQIDKWLLDNRPTVLAPARTLARHTPPTLAPHLAALAATLEINL